MWAIIENIEEMLRAVSVLPGRRYLCHIVVRTVQYITNTRYKYKYKYKMPDLFILNLVYRII